MTCNAVTGRGEGRMRIDWWRVLGATVVGVSAGLSWWLVATAFLAVCRWLRV